MSEKILALFEERLSRRQTLAKLGAGAVGIAVSMMALSRPASATVSFMCCNLCFDPRSGCNTANCLCSWCWACCDATSSNFVTYCCECHTDSAGACTTAACPGVNCSYISQPGTTC